jgi:hypothetical protein
MIHESMKSILILLIFTLLYTPVFGQQNDGTGQSNSHIYGDGFGARAREIPFVPGKEGSYYLYDSWSPGTIIMRNGEAVRDVFLKYNFQKRELEIKTDTVHFALSVSDTKQFTIYDDDAEAFRQFAAAQDYQLGGTPLTGALEVLYEGKVGLVARIAPKLVEANYSGALSGGSKNNKIIKEKEYFLVEDNQLVVLPTKRKESIDILQPYATNIEGYMKKNHLKPKREKDLVAIAEYISKQKR